jgi:hypothetical protein
MESEWRAFQGQSHSRLTAPTEQSFLFVDADEQKASRQGRRNARSFVMQRARKERPWSTSKHAAKQKVQGRASPGSSGTPDSSSAQSTATSTGIIVPIRSCVSAAEPESHQSSRQNGCPECQTVFRRFNGQNHCLVCQPVPARGPNSTLRDPFQASSVPLDRSVLELLKHCEYDLAAISAQPKFPEQTTEIVLSIGISWCCVAYLVGRTE